MFSSPLNSLLNGTMSPADLVALAVSLIVCITIHEFAHALAATWLGDPLPGRQGRLTLSPGAHLDPMGSLMFLIGGFGWGKPVQYNPYALRAGPRSGPAIVALAGPVSNFILAAVLAVIARLLPFAMNTTPGRLAGSPGMEGTLYELLLMIILYNLTLGVFNLIPIAPLDGFAVLLGLLPSSLAYQYEQTQRWGILILMGLMFLGGGIVGIMLYQPVGLLFRGLIGF
jgi:Zn-dependent protease